MDVDRMLVRLAAVSPYGVFTRWSALKAGVTAKMLANRVRRGLIEVLEPGVYRLATGAPPTWEQRVMAATIADAGVASHRTAAAVWQLDGCRPGIVEVVSERWRRRPNRSFRLHETTYLPPEDRAVHRGIPVTSIARTLADLAMVVPAYRVEVALDTHGVDPADVFECADRLSGRGRPWVATTRRLSAARIGRQGVTPNLFERTLYRILERAGLPLPLPQVDIRRADGTLVARVDWLFDPQRVILECDSFEWHGQWIRRKADLRRDRELTGLGYDTLRFSWEDLVEYPDVVARDVDAALRAVSA